MKIGFSMTRSRLALLIAALVIVIGALTQGARVLLRQRRQLQALQQRTEQLEKQISAQRHDRDDTQRELGLAEHQLAELPASNRAAEGASDRERETEVKAWLARLTRLKQLFEQRPDRRIPEMRLLSDEDWLRVGKRISLDTDENVRKALAAVRDAAKSRFSMQLASILQKYAKPPGGEQPATAMAFAPYFENPADVEALQRYEITNMDRPKAIRAHPVVDGAPLRSVLADSRWAVREIAPVDGDYDNRVQVTNDGARMSLNAPAAWIPDFQERLQQAAKAYADASHGTGPSGMAPLLPYINPPLDPAMIEKLLKAERDRQK